MSHPMSQQQAAAMAAVLFVSQVPLGPLAEPGEVTEVISQTTSKLGPDAAALALRETAYAYGDHPETAAPRIAACYSAVEGISYPLPGPRIGGTR
ncbi:hypothetical protein AB0E27_41370 [Streptomyces sparsogenes]|uniref:hypothetical protein n=1 Tax=Streptomyces sparsogenes TaxID=67365 RepID=UPI0033C4733E